MKRNPGLYIIIVFSAALALCVFLEGVLTKREREKAAQEYRQTHSLFEDIAISGEVPGGYSLSGGEEPAPAMQEILLVRRREDRWVAYLPSDLADRAHLRFRYFDSLELGPAEGETSGEKQVFQNGDLISCRELGNGSLRHAVLRDRRGGVLEEADLLIYHAEEVPTLYLTTESGSMEAVNADKSVREEGRYVFYTEAGKKDASGKCRIHGRGNSSWKEDKKQYSLNLGSPRTVLGIEESEKFALVANYSDSSMLRNRAVYDLAAMCGMPSTPETVFVNVYFNGVYNGLYLLAQRPNARGGSVRIHDLERDNLEAQTAAADDQEGTGGPSGQEEAEAAGVPSEPDGISGLSGQEGETAAPETVDLVDGDGLELHASAQEAVPENISGGYLLEMDGRYEEEDYWFSTKKHHFVVKFPEAVPLREEEYIAGCVRAAERAFYSEDGVDPQTGRSWEEYLDLDSWVRMYMMQDFMAQWDVESFSFFVYKDADDPLLYCGPVWDFDLSMGTTGIGNLPNVMKRSMWLRDHRDVWLTQLGTHPAFREALLTFAEEEFYPALETWLEGSDPLCASLVTSAAMDCHLWHKENTYEESARTLRDWLAGRMAFLKDYTENPGEYCTVTFRYGFSDMDIYVRRGEKLGFVPTEEYGEHLYGSFRRKYGEIGGWTAEDGSLLTPDTVIDRDQVFTPFSP